MRLPRAAHYGCIVTVTLLLASAGVAQSGEKQQPISLLDAGFRQMYNLQFDEAHKAFAEAERQRPDDPMAPASDAAAYLFAEFDRLQVLESELFVDNQAFETRSKLSPDPAVKRAFDARLHQATTLVNTALARNPNDSNALFAQVMIYGLTGDYLALIEKRDMKALGVVKQGREVADKLLSQDPTCYDAYIAIGIENYLLSQKAAPVRWLLRLTGAQTDKETGLQKLRLTAAKGRYLLPYARMLLAVAALRDHQPDQARTLLEGLLREFPHNHLYAKELAKLRPVGSFGTP